MTDLSTSKPEITRRLVLGRKAAKLVVQPEQVNSWLNWAGERLLSMPLPKPGPSAPNAYWPVTAAEKTTAADLNESRLKPLAPAKDEIKFIDEILELILLVSDSKVRRILQARALVAPISGKHLYSWTRLGNLLNSDRKRIACLHKNGLLAISLKIEPNKAKRITEFMRGMGVA